MIDKKKYTDYLISTQTNYTGSYLADHSSNLSHDSVSYFLKTKKFTPSQLWTMVSPHIENTIEGMLILDDSIQNKKYSRFIELVKRQYSGNEKGLVSGICVVNLVHSSGNDGDYFPIDYRIYDPSTDKKTKNDHFKEMFINAVASKNLKTRTVAFDSWYASFSNLKLIHRANWTFFTTLKSNRLVSLSKETGYQSLESLVFDEQSLVKGLVVRIKKVPFPVKLFKLVSKDGRIDWIITNNLDEHVNLFLAELKNENRWQIELFHREVKQLTGSEKCQARKARSQRNHLACCYHAWLSLKLKAKKLKISIYKLKQQLLDEYLIAQLNNPTIDAVC